MERSSYIRDGAVFRASKCLVAAFRNASKNVIANGHDPLSKIRTEAYTLDGRGSRGPVIRDGVGRCIRVPVASLLAAPQPPARLMRGLIPFSSPPRQENGAPVVDLVAADFAIKEDGKPREVLRVELANVPVQIAIIVDDNGTGIFRAGLVSFVRLHAGPRRDVAEHASSGQTQRLVDYTTDVEKLTDAIVSLTRATRQRRTAASCSKGSSRRQRIRRSARPSGPSSSR